MEDELRGLARENVKRLKAAGVVWVQWLASGLDDDPKRCRDANEQIVKLSKLRSGMHGKRCKCALIAVADPEPEAELEVEAASPLPVVPRPAFQGESEEQRRRRILEDFSRKLW